MESPNLGNPDNIEPSDALDERKDGDWDWDPDTESRSIPGFHHKLYDAFENPDGSTRNPDGSRVGHDDWDWRDETPGGFHEI